MERGGCVVLKAVWKYGHFGCLSSLQVFSFFYLFCSFVLFFKRRVVLFFFCRGGWQEIEQLIDGMWFNEIGR